MSTPLDKAKEIVLEPGENAAAWWEQDVSSCVDTEQVARDVLQGLEDGDPLVYDSFPSPDLSGQWADGYTPRDLVRDCEVERGIIATWLGLHAFEDELCDAYEQAFHDAVSDEIGRLCRNHIQSD